MRVLVTGAGGFLGGWVVRDLLKRGFAVRALVRSGRLPPSAEWQDQVQIIQGDLRVAEGLEALFSDVDVLIHLAATVRGTSEEQMTGTVDSTRRLLQAMQRSGVRPHVVLAGSFAVYDFSTAERCLSEDSSLEPDPAARDGYTAAKVAQERLVRHMANEHGWTLSVLRPGLIYGPGASPAASAGMKVGRLFFVVAPSARLRLTHVENCAAAFAQAAELRAAGTFNIVDDERISAWRYAGRLLRTTPHTVRVVFPYNAGLMIVLLFQVVTAILPKAVRRRLPGLLKPRVYRARFRPFEYNHARAKAALSWTSRPLFESGSDVT